LHKNVKILIVIPAYNEEKNIIEVINSIHSHNNTWDILVINDSSTDNTSEFAKKTGKAKVIDLVFNIGIGGTIQTGFLYSQKNLYDVMVQFDGDGQHIASEISKIINPILENKYDVIIGSRFLDKRKCESTTFSRRIGILLFEYLIYFLVKLRIKDPTSGFRAYNQKAINYIANIYPVDYPEPEAIMILKRGNLRISEVAVNMNKRIMGKSSISGLINIYYMIKVILSIFMVYLRNLKLITYDR
jgi:glycosyltransferase involved in cell wall biosynthesis